MYRARGGDEATAHPRVGGENALRAIFAIASAGSSPRRRGKRRANVGDHREHRLIPA